MVYKPIDVLLELMRTMLFEYLNAKIGKRKM